MILHYFKIAWRGLFRKKLYTLICLFGISFTLTILFVGTSLYDFMLKPNYPEYKQDRILVVDQVVAYGFTKNSSTLSSGALSYSFMSKFILNLKTPGKISILRKSGERVIYWNNLKINFMVSYTDAKYWEIFDFECIEGKLYNEVEIYDNEMVAVISESVARKYFLGAQSVTGQSIEIDAVTYKVMGVVKDVPETRSISHSDVWLPLTVPQEVVPDFIGSYTACLLASKVSDLDIIKDELKKHLKEFRFSDYYQGKSGIQQYKDFTGIQVFAHTHVEKFFEKILKVNKSLSKEGISEIPKFKKSSFYLLLISAIILLLSFPAINLINIHISRFMERSSEIGIRRTYGARKQTLLNQLIVENLLLTCLGAVLAFIFSLIILKLIEAGDYFPQAKFILNLRISGWGIFFTLLFNLFTIMIPAWKVSRSHIIQSLKGGEL